jgi:hypothetical protein
MVNAALAQSDPRLDQGIVETARGNVLVDIAHLAEQKL